MGQRIYQILKDPKGVFKKKVKSVDFSALFLVGGIGWLEHFHPKILPLRACLDLDLDICYDQS